MALYWFSSTILGSIMIKRKSSGEALYKRLMIILLMHTLLPEPVAPAMSTWGILLMSPIIFCPDRVLPSAKGRGPLKPSKAGVSMISRRPTITLSSFGTSMPTAAFPGIGASIRISEVARFKARSSAKLTILLTFTPGSG